MNRHGVVEVVNSHGVRIGVDDVSVVLSLDGRTMHYLVFDEAMDVRNELNRAIQLACENVKID
jgi:hypothetical protein